MKQWKYAYKKSKQCQESLFYLKKKLDYVLSTESFYCHYAILSQQKY